MNIHHAGPCCGGPLDGKMLDHWINKLHIERPVDNIAWGSPVWMPSTDFAPGYYKYDLGQWTWEVDKPQ